MCGRFALYEKLEKLKEEFPQVFFPEDLAHGKLEARYNISPGTGILGLAGNSKGIKAGYFHWGLVPAWATETKVGYKMTNARAETLGEKKSYQGAFQSRRCVILANGFFEWLRTDSGKAPYFIGLAGQSVFAMAAIWERWQGQGKDLISASIITSSANEQMAPIHQRMPILLRPDEIESWLYEGFEKQGQILKPFAGKLEIFPVAKDVNSSKNQGPDLILPLSS